MSELSPFFLDQASMAPLGAVAAWIADSLRQDSDSGSGGSSMIVAGGRSHMCERGRRP